MATSRPLVSVIMVTYKEVRELVAGLTAVFASLSQTEAKGVEVIVVDNDPGSKLSGQLKRKFPQVKYVKTGQNIGFGPANNVGAAQAHGSFLFFLNPDTEIEPGAIRTLRLFLSKNSQAAVTAPMLSDMHGQLYLDQGSTRLTPLTALASHSIVHRLWPNNPVAQEYWLRHRPVDQPQQVEVVPGTAFMIRTSIFKQIGGFDEQFFIYFEESDLCRRVVELGYECWLLPSAKVKHIWHAATQASHYKQIYKQSRYKYFKKYYGVVVAWLVELLLRVGKRELLIMSLAIIGVTIWLGILVTR